MQFEASPGASYHTSLNLQPMCGRYALTRTELLEEFFEFSFTGNQILPRYNVAPSTQIPVIRLRDDGQRELIDLRWGLVPSWSRPGDQLPLLINARAETLSSTPAFRDAFQRRRCIVPASGYYEWQKLPGGAKQPFYITRRDGLPIAFAGLWENAKELHGTAAIVTTAASEETQPIHDRMPVILEKPDFPRWLASHPYDDHLVMIVCPVEARVVSDLAPWLHFCDPVILRLS